MGAALGQPLWGPLGRKPWAPQAFDADPSATQDALSPWPCQQHWHGLAGHRSLLEVAVGSCDDPVLVDQGAAAEVGSCGGLGREERRGAGAGQAEHPQAGDRQRSPGSQLAMPVLRTVPREGDSAVPAGTLARARSQAQRSAH